jgi:hypothetical protein
MDVKIDQAGKNEHSSGIDRLHSRLGRDSARAIDRSDFAVFDPEVALLVQALGGVDEFSILNQ